MAVDEASRFRLHRRLDELLGSPEATTLMEHLPLGGWSQVATKQDIAQLRQDLDFQMDTKLEALRSDLKHYTLWTILITNTALVTAATAISRIG